MAARDAWSPGKATRVAVDRVCAATGRCDCNFRTIRGWISVLGRLSYEMGGMTLEVKGRQAPREEAPVLVAAPHSTFLDAGIVYLTGYPSIICRKESGRTVWLRSTSPAPIHKN